MLGKHCTHRAKHQPWPSFVNGSMSTDEYLQVRTDSEQVSMERTQMSLGENEAGQGMCEKSERYHREAGEVKTRGGMEGAADIRFQGCLDRSHEARPGLCVLLQEDGGLRGPLFCMWGWIKTQAGDVERAATV